MKTLSPTQARANMTRWLDQAIAGQSIGITHKGRIVKLQPVPVTEDWAAEEYGLTGEELDRAADQLDGEPHAGHGQRFWQKHGWQKNKLALHLSAANISANGSSLRFGGAESCY